MMLVCHLHQFLLLRVLVKGGCDEFATEVGLLVRTFLLLRISLANTVYCNCVPFILALRSTWPLGSISGPSPIGSLSSLKARKQTKNSAKLLLSAYVLLQIF